MENGNDIEDLELDDYSRNSFDMSSEEEEDHNNTLDNIPSTTKKKTKPSTTTSTETTTLNSPINTTTNTIHTSPATSATTTSVTNSTAPTTASDTPIRTSTAEGNSFYARLNALSANRTGTTSNLNMSRTQPMLRGGSPVRTRLEKLSNRLAARAQQIAQEKRERESAILDHVQALERRLDANNSRMENMERQYNSLLEELSEERKARLSLESTYQEEITSLTHRVGRLKQEVESKMENNIQTCNATITEQLEMVISNLNKELDDVKKRLKETEQTIPNHHQLTMEVKRLIEVERKVKVETERMLMKLLDDTFTQFRINMKNEKQTRERNEEAMLQILENMSDTTSTDM